MHCQSVAVTLGIKHIWKMINNIKEEIKVIKDEKVASLRPIDNAV